MLVSNVATASSYGEPLTRTVRDSFLSYCVTSPDTFPFFLLGEVSKRLLDAGKRRDDRRGGGSRRRCRMRCLRSPKHAPCGRHLDFQPSPEAEDFVQEPSHFGTSTSQSQVMLSSNSV